jgi:hypothetical protein
VCIQDRSRGKLQRWIEVDRFASELEDFLLRRGVRDLYLTKSSYIPEQTWRAIVEKFKRRGRVGLAKSASELYSGEWLNHVERQLAIDARIFIPEGFSTWSSTVLDIRNQSRDQITYLYSVFS